MPCYTLIIKHYSAFFNAKSTDVFIKSYDYGVDMSISNQLILPDKLVCGYFDSSAFGPIKTTQKRTCSTFEIEYFLEDGNNIFLNGDTYRVKKNRIHICSPGDVRNSELPFKTKYVKFYAEGKLAELLESAPRYFRVYRSFEALSLLDEIIMLNTSEDCDELLLHGKLLTYVSLVLDEAAQSLKAKPYSSIIMQAQNYIKEHYGKQIKLSDIANEVNLSQNYFHTLFTDACGQTPHDYLVEHRVNAAKNLLVTTQLSLSEIAEHCGFKNQQYLASVFKTKTGVSPTQFKRDHQSAYFTI